MTLDAMTTILKKGIPKRGYFLTYLDPEGSHTLFRRGYIL